MFSSNCMSPADMAAVMGTNNRGNDAFGGYGADMIIWLIATINLATMAKRLKTQTRHFLLEKMKG